MERKRARWTIAGQIVEVDMIVCLKNEWDGAQESTDKMWSTGEIDLNEVLDGELLRPVPPLLIALKLGEIGHLVPLVRR
jgi:hypothetical protein